LKAIKLLKELLGLVGYSHHDSCLFVDGRNRARGHGLFSDLFTDKSNE
jgi:hypothetical protein